MEYVIWNMEYDLIKSTRRGIVAARTTERRTLPQEHRYRYLAICVHQWVRCYVPYVYVWCEGVQSSTEYRTAALKYVTKAPLYYSVLRWPGMPCPVARVCALSVRMCMCVYHDSGVCRKSPEGPRDAKFIWLYATRLQRWWTAFSKEVVGANQKIAINNATAS